MRDLSIVIVNWNTRDLLAQCLQSVYDTTGSLDFEVVVVDNASTDGSQAMVRNHFPQAQLIENQKNEGFARANNQAICASRGRYILLLNSDTIVQLGALEAMVHFADRHPEAGIVGCKLLNADGSLQPSWAQFPTFWSELMGRNFRKWRPMADDQAFEVDWVGGACLLARRKAIEMVGLLDEDFFMYSEETDWCFRVVRNGWKVCFLPGTGVIHFGGGSSRRASDKTLVQLYQSKLRFFHKHYGPSYEEFMRTLFIITSLTKGVSLAALSLLKKADSPTKHSYKQHFMLSRELLRGLRTGSEH